MIITFKTAIIYYSILYIYKYLNKIIWIKYTYLNAIKNVITNKQYIPYIFLIYFNFHRLIGFTRKSSTHLCNS